MTIRELILSDNFKEKTILLLDQNLKKPTIELGVFGMMIRYLKV